MDDIKAVKYDFARESKFNTRLAERAKAVVEAIGKQ